jgi:hypothetical protein
MKFPESGGFFCATFVGWRTWPLARADEIQERKAGRVKIKKPRLP